MVKNPPVNAGDAGDTGSIPGLGRSPGGGNGNPLHYSCLGNPMNRGAWRATLHGVAESRTGLSAHICTATSSRFICVVAFHERNSLPFQDWIIFHCGLCNHLLVNTRRRKWQPTPVFLPGESHGQRSLAGYSAWGQQRDTTELLSTLNLGVAPISWLLGTLLL